MKTRIRELRKKYGLVQEELAKKVGVRGEIIVFLKKEKYNPSLLLAYRIAKVFRQRIGDVFIFKDSTKNHKKEKRSNK